MSKPKTTQTCSVIKEAFEEATNTGSGMPDIISEYIEDLDGFPDGQERQCLKDIDIWIEHFWNSLNQSNENRTSYLFADIFVDLDGGDDSNKYEFAFDIDFWPEFGQCPFIGKEFEKEYGQNYQQFLQIIQMIKDYHKEHPDYHPKHRNRGLAKTMAIRFESDGTTFVSMRGDHTLRLSLEQAREKFRDLIKNCIRYGFYTFEFIYLFHLKKVGTSAPFPRFFDRALKLEPWRPKHSSKTITLAYYYVPDIFVQERWQKNIGITDRPKVIEMKMLDTYGRRDVAGIEIGSSRYLKQLRSNFRDQIERVADGVFPIFDIIEDLSNEQLHGAVGEREESEPQYIHLE